MEPTLQQSDRLYVNRFLYTPKKGDIIIFRPASDPKRPYVKRVIATEGDTVYIDFETGEVFVNVELKDEPYILEPTHRNGSYIMGLMEHGTYSKEKPITVEKGKIFVMGDNRNNSKDSREIGQVPKSEIIGHALFRFWPFNNMKLKGQSLILCKSQIRLQNDIFIIYHLGGFVKSLHKIRG